MKRNTEKRLSNAWFGGYGHRYDRKAHNKPFRRRIKEQSFLAPLSRGFYYATIVQWRRKMSNDELIAEFESITKELVKLFAKKQHDYGPGNIAEFGEVGVLVRLNDKMERLKNLVLNGLEASNESIEDTLDDIASYAIIYKIVRRGKWDGAKQFVLKRKA